MGIHIEQVSKKFGSQIVLDHINLRMEYGRIYGLVGYNGSGKTVLMKCICGLLHVDEGKITVDDYQIGENMLRNGGVIIEEPAFLKSYTGRKNLELLYMLNHKRDKEVVSKAMRMTGLDPENRKRVRNYSLGMRQRLALAQAVMENPKILILDEPMNGLDKRGVDEIRKMLLEFRSQGKLILLASHNREDINFLCDEVYEIEDGKIEKTE